MNKLISINLNFKKCNPVWSLDLNTHQVTSMPTSNNIWQYTFKGVFSVHGIFDYRHWQNSFTWAILWRLLSASTEKFNTLLSVTQEEWGSCCLLWCKSKGNFVWFLRWYQDVVDFIMASHSGPRVAALARSWPCSGVLWCLLRGYHSVLLVIRTSSLCVMGQSKPQVKRLW